ncbi:MAG TPA: redox-regulated ATPase YchF [Anaeromyxobacteraceae bacterium]|nr:redox-regulated ATPase YchF [Anaeromyxobacteraceae bacterium]
MALGIGIVGLPNVGKSTLFNALSGSAKALAANYPFCTIEPNRSIVLVPDERLARLCAQGPPRRATPTTLEFIDIAGLVKGASRGEGLGNQFLSHIREVDAVAHVLRCFDDPDVVHLTGAVDPRSDREVVETELMLKDLETLEKRRERAHKGAKAPGKPGELARAELAVLDAVKGALERGVPVRAQGLGAEDQAALSDLALLTGKPVIYIANVDEAALRAAGEDPRVKAVLSLAREEGAEAVVLCGQVEAEIAELAPGEQKAFLADLGLEEPGLERLVSACYRALGLITFFTRNEEEVRAWTVARGTRAPQAAGRIHTDFERGFVKAEVMAVEELISLGSEQAAREKGRLRVEGKEYVVEDGDFMHFKFNV